MELRLFCTNPSIYIWNLNEYVKRSAINCNWRWLICHIYLLSHLPDVIGFKPTAPADISHPSVISITGKLAGVPACKQSGFKSCSEMKRKHPLTVIQKFYKLINSLSLSLSLSIYIYIYIYIHFSVYCYYIVPTDAYIREMYAIYIILCCI